MTSEQPTNEPAGSHLRRSFAVCWSGGSGIAHGLRLVQVLLEAGHEVHLCATDAAHRVLEHEAGLRVDDESGLAGLFAESLRGRLRVHAVAAVEAAPSSGSAGIEAVIVAPCSMGTLSRIAAGASRNLVERAADVTIKEGRTLIVVPRESPLSAIHLQNMLTLARLGVVVMPAMPGFYHRPRSVDELIDFMVARILDRLGVEHSLAPRWRTPEPGGVGEPGEPGDEGEEDGAS